MAVASFLVQTVSKIREGNEVQVVDESNFNVYASDAAMYSSKSTMKGKWTMKVEMKFKIFRTYNY